MIQKIYKFGGASVKDADAVRNLADIVSQHKDEDILLVVSAMGKTTNMLEKVLADFREHDGTHLDQHHPRIPQQVRHPHALVGCPKICHRRGRYPLPRCQS